LDVVQKVLFPGYTGSRQSRAGQRFPRFACYPDLNHAPEGDKRRHGYSRDKRADCPQVVIALVVTPDGLPLAYEVLPGNTADCKTLVIAHPIPTGYTPLKINHIFP
jgi:hypothetical protein